MVTGDIIPNSHEYPVMNISHLLLFLLYKLVYTVKSPGFYGTGKDGTVLVLFKSSFKWHRMRQKSSLAHA
jgi:hypothetical protein